MTLAKINTEHGTLTKAGLDASAEQLKLLEDYVRNVLRRDEDYGVIPGTNGKQTLLKPGAANVIAAFNCHIDGDDKCALEILDPSQGKHGFVAYRIVVRIVSNQDGAVRAMGQGACNSYEAKYRYRNAQPKCPVCDKENIRKSNHGDGFYCWKKTGGCGTNFDADDQDILQQPIGKVENDNPLEQANTILKMAVKRATVDAALQLPGVARLFTQDFLEDMDDGTEKTDAKATTKAQDTPPAPRPSHSTDKTAETQTVRSGETPSGNSTPQKELLTLGDLFNACQQTFGLKSIDTVVVLATIAGKPVIAKDIQSVFGSFDAAFAAIKEDRSKMEQPEKFPART